MPIYEFKCVSCNKIFDQLCAFKWEGTVSCPACGNKEVVKVVSNVSTPGTGGASSGCGSCSSSNCRGCH